MTRPTLVRKELGLRSLLGSLKKRPGFGALSRKQRLAIAAAATWAALYLCGTPWLASDWNGKDDVHLFLGKQGRREHAEVLADQPSISHTFKPTASIDPARPADVAARFQTRQIRNRALSTLGVLLVELCLDKTFEQIQQESQDNDFGASLEIPGTTSSVPPSSDFDVATGCIDEVFLSEGELYGDAVQRCLRCEFPGRDVTKDFNFREFRQNFFEGVVAPVQATYESSI